MRRLWEGALFGPPLPSAAQGPEEAPERFDSACKELDSSSEHTEEITEDTLRILAEHRKS